MKCFNNISCLLLFATIVLADDSSEESNKVKPVLIQPQNYTKPLFGMKIIGGSKAREHQFPWQASIITYEDKYYYTCGGSLISQRFVLTAAHCTDTFDLFDIGLGSSYFGKPAVKLTSTVKYQHPLYDKEVFANDISVILLPRRVELSEAVQTIPLAKPSIGNSFERNATVSGFGRTSDTSKASESLNFVDLQIISNSECATYYKRGFVRQSTICAVGFNQSNQNTCFGDSGGPLIVKKENNVVQIGIVSFGSTPSCEKGVPSGFARVSSFTNWIQAMTGMRY